MGFQMDQASIVGFALAYFVTIITVIILFLPAIAIFTILLLLAGIARLVGLLFSVAAIRPLQRLGRRIRKSAHEFRMRSHGPTRLLPH
ncbi:hypothetical protein GCM10009589_03680 [Arthrobacter pascens]